MARLAGALLGSVLLAAACQAQSAPMPSEPNWSWTVNYAAVRLNENVSTWANQIQQIARDGNNLTPAQSRLLQESADAVLTAGSALNRELDAPLTIVPCPARLDQLVAAYAATLQEFARGASPPWTAHDHRAFFSSTATLLWGFRAELGCFPVPPVSRPSPGTASIGGRVLDAATGQPLAEVAIFAQAGALTGPVETSADGAWRIGGLSPTCYLVTTLAPGYAEAVDLVPASGVRACGPNMVNGSVMNPQSNSQVTFRLQPSPVRDVPYGPLVAAYPLDQVYLTYGGARFSPDGRQLALVVNGDVWRYDLATGVMLRLGSLPTAPTGQSYELAWEGGNLLIRGVGPAQGALIAGSGGIHPAPAPESALPSSRFVTVESGVTAGPYAISTLGQGHGSDSLFVRNGSAAPHLIAAGSRELGTSKLDTKRLVVFYPTYGAPIGQVGIVAYDLPTGSSRLTPLSNRAQKLMDAVRVPGGTLIAYVVNGDCNGIVFGAMYGAMQRPLHMCLVTIPDAASH